MDGMVNLGYLPLMEKNYHLMDLRFKHVGSKPHSPSRSEVNLVFTITTLELFVMSALCYLAFYGIRMRTAWSHEAEIVLNVVSCFLRSSSSARPLKTDSVLTPPLRRSTDPHIRHHRLPCACPPRKLRRLCPDWEAGMLPWILALRAILLLVRGGAQRGVARGARVPPQGGGA